MTIGSGQLGWQNSVYCSKLLAHASRHFGEIGAFLSRGCTVYAAEKGVQHRDSQPVGEFILRFCELCVC
jgi:hypothetical protein